MTTAEPGEPSAERLLVRDLAQLVTHRGSAAPLRGSELREVELVENAFVLAEGGMIVATGRMADLGIPAPMPDFETNTQCHQRLAALLELPPPGRS